MQLHEVLLQAEREVHFNLQYQDRPRYPTLLCDSDATQLEHREATPSPTEAIQAIQQEFETGEETRLQSREDQTGRQSLGESPGRG